jgi:hypothetical protein
MNMEDADLADDDLLTNDVVINLNVICVLVLYGVGGEVDGVDVLTIDKHAPTQRTVKVLKQLAQQVGLSHAIRNSAVFRLCTSARDNVLTLR